MPEQLARDMAWLCGGLLYAWLVCALAQLAALAPAWARRAPESASDAVKRRQSCRRVREVQPPARTVLAISFALLLTVPPGVLAMLVAHTPAAAAAAEIGALAGLWLGARHDLTKRARATALAGGAVGVATLCVCFVIFLLLPALPVSGRAALYVAVTLGALLTGAASNALACGLHAGGRSRLPARNGAFCEGDRALHAVAFVLFAVLGYGFAASRVVASAEFGLSVLVAASVLAAALGVRLMSGAGRRAAPRRGSALAPAGAQPDALAQAVTERLARTRFAGVPDAWLVGAHGSAAFEPAAFDSWLADYEPPGIAPRASHPCLAGFAAPQAQPQPSRCAEAAPGPALKRAVHTHTPPDYPGRNIDSHPFALALACERRER
jgi:hypothetical protein